MGKGSNQRALVIGVSNYPNPKDKLPAVAADVREMAKVLSSRNGTFASKSIKVLADNEATRDSVLAALVSAFEGSEAETVFVYIAGHGMQIGGKYYYVAYDTANESTAVPLATIKALFDSTKSRRAFLWLDFCHSGGILARGDSEDIDIIKREIGVVSGHGKVIVAACTAAQLSYESSTLGHGFFTHALLRGLQGEAKSSQGEVTAHSLYEFIDHQVTNQRQQPVFFGETTGRIVLAYYPVSSEVPVNKPLLTKTVKKKGKNNANKSGTWVMLGDHFFLADSVRHTADNKIEFKVTTANGPEAAIFAALRAKPYGASSVLPFAVNTEAQLVRVQAIESISSDDKQVWSLTMTVNNDRYGSNIEMNYNVGNKTYSVDDIARLRAGRILINDPAPHTRSNRGYSVDDSILSWIEGTGSYPIKDCIVRNVYSRHGTNPEWITFARLSAVFILKAAGIVEHVVELNIDLTKDGTVKVKFRGQRARQYTNTPPTIIEIDGECSLIP
jgi:hypothetical protein